MICDDFFFGYWKSWPEVLILFQNLRSELVYTFKWTKSVARLWRNQICEPDLERKKNSPTYRPIGEMEGRVREANIFLRVAQSLPLSWSTIDVKILNWKSPPAFFYKLLEIFLPTEQIYFLCFMTWSIFIMIFTITWKNLCLDKINVSCILKLISTFLLLLKEFRYKWR
jgi:hypothetical protein